MQVNQAEIPESTRDPVLRQGLLDMHTLLDNPFGRHCAKFPLRAQITELMNTCRAILRLGQENREPECYEVRAWRQCLTLPPFAGSGRGGG